MFYFRIVIIAVLSTAIATSSDSNLSYVDIPCFEYREGTKWTEITTSSQLNSKTEYVVLLNKNNKIRYQGTTVNTTYNNKYKANITFLLREGNKTIYGLGEIVNSNGFKMRSNYDTEAPLCGKVPKHYSYKSSSKSQNKSYSIPKSKYTINIEKVGNSEIETPMGNYMAEIFQKNVVLEILGMNNAVLTKLAITQYYVPRYGLVKSIASSITIPPKALPGNKDSGKSLLMLKPIRSKYITEMIDYEAPRE